MKRTLATKTDFVKHKCLQRRFGELVEINPIDSIKKVGLIKDRNSLMIDDYMVEFSGLYEENDIGQGLFIRDDTITENEDLGVILNINNIKYRRQYEGAVYLDWFGNDYVLGLSRALKYSYIKCTMGKMYDLEFDKPLTCLIRHNVEIDGNGSIFNLRTTKQLYNFFTFNFNIPIDYFVWTNTKFIFATHSLIDINRQYNVKYLDFYTNNTFPIYTNDILAEYDISKLPHTNGRLMDTIPAKISGQYTFLKAPVVTHTHELTDNDFVRIKDLGALKVNNDVMTKNTNQTITGKKTFLKIVGMPNATIPQHLCTKANLQQRTLEVYNSLKAYMLAKAKELGLLTKEPEIYPIGYVYLQFINLETKKFELFEQPDYLFGGGWKCFTENEEVHSFGNVPDTLGMVEENFEVKQGGTDMFIPNENTYSMPKHIAFKGWKRVS